MCLCQSAGNGGNIIILTASRIRNQSANFAQHFTSLVVHHSCEQNIVRFGCHRRQISLSLVYIRQSELRTEMWLKKRFNALRGRSTCYVTHNNNDQHQISDGSPCPFINITWNDLRGDHYLQKSEKNAYRDYSRQQGAVNYARPPQQQKEQQQQPNRQQQPFMDKNSLTFCDRQLKKINVS